MKRLTVLILLVLATAAAAKGPFPHPMKGFGWPWGPEKTSEVHLKPGVAVYVSGRLVWDGWKCVHGQ